MKVSAFSTSKLICFMVMVLLYILPLVVYRSENSIVLVLLLFIILPSHFLCKVLVTKKIFQSIFEAFHVATSLVLLLFILFSMLYKVFSISKLFLYMFVTLIPLSLFIVDNYLIRKNEQNIDRGEQKALKAHLIFISLSLLILYLVLKTVQRTYSADETSYVFNTQLFEQYRIMPPFGVSPYASTVSKYLVGRFVWSSYLYSIKFFTGVEPHRLHLAGILFAVLLASVSMSILHDVLHVSNTRLSLLVSLVVLSSPVILPWSITALLDLPQTYFILVSIYFISKSIKITQGIIKDIDLSRFFLGMLYAFLSILFKANILTPVLLIILFTIELYRCRRHLATSARRLFRALAILLIIAMVYVLIVDFGYFVSWYFFGNWELANTLRKYMFYEQYSISESLFGMIVEFPWDHYTIFSYSWKRWLDFINFALAPEALTILVSSTFLVFPFLIITVHENRTDVRFRILALSTYVSFWLYFFILIGNNQLHDFTRYGLHIYALAIVLSIATLYRGLQNRHALRVTILVAIATMVLLSINYIVTLEYGGTKFFFDMRRYRYSFTVLLTQASFIILFSMLLKDCVVLRRYFLNGVLLSALLSFSIFNNAVFTKSWLYSATALDEVKEYLEDMYLSIDGKSRIVVSNSYIYLRNYVNLGNFIPIPPPAREDEFKEMLQLLPNGSLVILTNNPRISWYEYGNRYIKKYCLQTYIPIEYLGPYVVPRKPRIEILVNELAETLSNGNVVINGSIVETPWGRGVALDGLGNYIAIYNHILGNTYTIELLFKLDENPAEFGVYPQDVPWVGGKPVTKSLLAKRYHGYEEIAIAITSNGQVVVYADDKDDKSRFEIRTKEGIIRKGEWYHLVLVVDHTHARLYINGFLVGEYKVFGENMVLEDKGIRGEPLYVGADGTSVFKPWRYLKATIKLLRIYDGALSQEQIMAFYIHVKRVAIIKHGNYVHVIYVKEETSNRKAYTYVESKIKLVDATMNPKGVCVLNIESNLNSSLIIATIRFSKVVNISKGRQVLSFPYFHNNDRSSGIKEATYICSYHIALDSLGNILWLYVKHGMNYVELLMYHIALLTLLAMFIVRKASSGYGSQQRLHSS